MDLLKRALMGGSGISWTYANRLHFVPHR